MAISTQVRAAINKSLTDHVKPVKKIVAYFGVFSFGVLLIAGFKIYSLAAFAAAFIFWKMIQEDYQSQTIDLRLCLLLGCIFFFTSPDYKIFLFKSLLGMLVFEIVCFGTVKIADKTALSMGSQASLQDTQQKCYGYIPFLGLSLLLYLGYKDFYGLPQIIPLEALDILEEWIYADIWTVFTAIAVLMAINLLLIARIYRAKKAGKMLVPGLGDGDPLVLGVFAGVLKWSDLFSVFFISLLLSAAFLLILKVRKRH